jgi:Protein of unknown function (DUF2911)
MPKTFLCIAVFFMLACNNANNGNNSSDTIPAAKKQSLNIKKENSHPYTSVDASPMDMSYFPTDYPHIKHQLQDLPVMRLIYSRPQKKGRAIMGNVVKYDQMWRLGANECTEIEFFKPVTIQQKKVPAGRYTLYCMPRKDHWQIVLNSGLYGWGLDIDISKDMDSFTATVETTTAIAEYFTAVFEKTETGANLVFAWDDTVAKLPIIF